MLIRILSPPPGKLVHVTYKYLPTGSVHSLNFFLCVCPETLDDLCARVGVIGVDEIFTVVHSDVAVYARYRMLLYIAHRSVQIIEPLSKYCLMIGNKVGAARFGTSTRNVFFGLFLSTPSRTQWPSWHCPHAYLR